MAPNTTAGNNLPQSPFFRPSTPTKRREVEILQTLTPRGSKRNVKVTKLKSDIPQEHKSSRLGCAANLINAIVGSGIVGIPYAMEKSGLVAGIVMIVVCATITEKSLRLLIATAKHIDVPSYETLLEAVFGRTGFVLVSVNMFIMAWGAMVSYLIIVKDMFSTIIGIEADDEPMKRSIMFLVSLTIMVPLSSQRDMADLAKTSRVSVLISTLMVCTVAYISPIQQTIQDHDGFLNMLFPNEDENDSHSHSNNIVHWNTIFVGLGVLSFAYVCQHSAFIIAGSLEKPTITRWSQVTKTALIICCVLTVLCGVSGYLGYLENTNGNILMNLPTDSKISNMARAMLGCTMLFVYPMESFVARHVCVVLLFEGRRAHDGEDSSILNRSDRRIGLTLALYAMAVVPATFFHSIGPVLALTGTVAGSFLSYIGPGLAYLGVHGDQFMNDLSAHSWWRGSIYVNDTKKMIFQRGVGERTPLIGGESFNSIHKSNLNKNNNKDESFVKDISPCCTFFQTITWYIFLMPIWWWIADHGNKRLVKYKEELILKSPHPMRIGNVSHHHRRFTNKNQHRNDEEKQQKLPTTKTINKTSIFNTPRRMPPNFRDDNLPLTNSTTIYQMAPSPKQPKNQHLIIPPLDNNNYTASTTETKTNNIDDDVDNLIVSKKNSRMASAGVIMSKSQLILNKEITSSLQLSDCPSINSQIGMNLMRQKKANAYGIIMQIDPSQKRDDDSEAQEDDPQDEIPKSIDFVTAIFFMIFGIIALMAGLVSMAVDSS